MQRSPFVFPPTWSLAALWGPHSNTVVGTHKDSSTTNCFRNCMLTHQRYFPDGAAENMNQTNEAQVISPQRPELVFKYHAGDSSQVAHCCCCCCCCSLSIQAGAVSQQTCLQFSEPRSLSELSWMLMPSRLPQLPRSWVWSSTTHSCES